MRMRSLIAPAALLLLAGCSAGTPTPINPEDDPSVELPCIVGTWQLNVADYAAQSEDFVLGLGLPIEEFAMDGSGTITFTPDGLVTSAVDLTTTGTIVAGDTRVPLNQRSAYSGTGDWAAGDVDDTIDLTNWANVYADGAVEDAAEDPIPAIDYTDIPTVTAICTEHDLVLQGPDAPLSALWHR